MPVHDWARVDAGTFHCFHVLWLGDLTKALNGGLLPGGYYAMAEQVASRMQTDLLTLSVPVPPEPAPGEGGVALAEAPPRARVNVRPDPRRKPRRPTPRSKHVVVRHVSTHRVVALIEIVSPANKDRRDNVRDFTEKVFLSLEAGIHVLVLDLFRPGKYDPAGMHGAVWRTFDTAAYAAPPEEPLTLASYAWDGQEPVAYVEPLAVGQALIDMPLFLTAERYVDVPLESTYVSAYRGMPAFWRGVLESVNVKES